MDPCSCILFASFSFDWHHLSRAYFPASQSIKTWQHSNSTECKDKIITSLLKPIICAYTKQSYFAASDILFLWVTENSRFSVYIGFLYFFWIIFEGKDLPSFQVFKSYLNQFPEDSHVIFFVVRSESNERLAHKIGKLLLMKCTLYVYSWAERAVQLAKAVEKLSIYSRGNQCKIDRTLQCKPGL